MPPPHESHEPLSRQLERLLNEPGEGPFTANRLLAATGGRGAWLVMVLLALPFVAWVSVPGLSTLAGPMIAILALRLAYGRIPRLPARFGDRPLNPKTRQAILTGGLRVCCWIEKVIRPRRTRWLRLPWVRRMHGWLIAVLGGLLALPLPSPPFFGSNTLPSYAIILLAFSLMEEDGWMILVAYLMSLVAISYFIILAGLIGWHLVEWFDLLVRLLHRAG
ncbi:MAG: exopolysaccharide biosynthesis protein [Verrucomicrobiota bacterium]|nr:exopolysaccharide biosynthesis protein [Limisphaera sp.]MDW8382267.1 exopolysaccharide biosynthesis protein [Verrucomicrobiota bacterium]